MGRLKSKKYKEIHECMGIGKLQNMSPYVSTAALAILIDGQKTSV